MWGDARGSVQFPIILRIYLETRYVRGFGRLTVTESGIDVKHDGRDQIDILRDLENRKKMGLDVESHPQVQERSVAEIQRIPTSRSYFE